MRLQLVQSDKYGTSQLSLDENGNKRVNEYVREYKIRSGSYRKGSLPKPVMANAAFHKSHLLKLRVTPSETAMTDVLREVLIMKMLNHPNIVNLIEVIDDPDAYHFYMGARKSLLNVFQDRNCHPGMAMTTNVVLVLCMARNVACNVRGGFFKEFDENLPRRLFEYFYEDETSNLPSALDVSIFLMSEDASFVPNGNTNAPVTDRMNGHEVAQRLNQQ
ncbi:RNA polymerase II C-terminal domain phosphatase-like protein 2 isoform X2, partial [Tanacetum coccineum]